MAGSGTARRINVRRAFFLLCALTCGAAFAQPKSADPSRAAARAALCEKCHGTPQREPLPGAPYLAGQQYQFLELQMFLFREGLRDAPQMAGVLKDITDRDFADLGAYFTRQTPPRSKGKLDPKLH